MANDSSFSKPNSQSFIPLTTNREENLFRNKLTKALRNATIFPEDNGHKQKLSQIANQKGEQNEEFFKNYENILKSKVELSDSFENQLDSNTAKGYLEKLQECGMIAKKATQPESLPKNKAENQDSEMIPLPPYLSRPTSEDWNFFYAVTTSLPTSKPSSETGKKPAPQADLKTDQQAQTKPTGTSKAETFEVIKKTRTSSPPLER